MIILSLFDNILFYVQWQRWNYDVFIFVFRQPKTDDYTLVIYVAIVCFSEKLLCWHGKFIVWHGKFIVWHGKFIVKYAYNADHSRLVQHFYKNQINYFLYNFLI